MKRLRLALSLVDWGIAVPFIVLALVAVGLVVVGIGACRHERALQRAGWHYHNECVEVDCSVDVGDVPVPCTTWRCR